MRSVTLSPAYFNWFFSSCRRGFGRVGAVVVFWGVVDNGAGHGIGR